MNVLIIGGTSFMGPQVARRLVRGGHAVTVFHRGKTPGDLPEEVRHIYCPDLDFGTRRELVHYRETLRGLGADVVLDMIPMTEAAVRLTQEVFHGAARRLVAASSMDVYRAFGVVIGTEPGEPDPAAITEDSPLRSRLYPYRSDPLRAADDPQRWRDDYDKIPVEQAVLSDAALPGTVLRLPAVYGPGDRQHRLFEYLKRMDDRRPYILLDEQAAGWRWTRGYVENMAAAITLAVSDERAAGRIYNVGEPQSLSTLEWVRAIAGAAGWAGVIELLPSDALPPVLQSDINAYQHLVVETARIRAELGYVEEIGFAEALARAIAWERANPPAQIDPVQFDYGAEDAAWQVFSKLRR